MSKKLLLLAYYFPPLAASGSLRAAGFSRHLPEHSFDLRVLTVDPGSAYPPVGTDPSLEATLPRDLCIERLVFSTPLRRLLRFRASLRERIGMAGSPERKATSGETGSGSGKESRLAKAKSRLLDRIFLFPDHQYPWIRAVLDRIRSLPSPERPDIVLATGNPWSSLVAANRLAKELGIPYVADFRDPWIGNPKPPQRRGVLMTAEALERRVVAGAAAVVANTEELRQDFMRRYPAHSEKFVTIPNGFEPACVTDAPANPGNPGSGLELSYFGSVSALRNPFALLEALDEASREGRFSPSELRVRFVGTWEPQSPECEALAAELEDRGFLHREPGVPHDECLRRMKRSDCLLILQQSFPLQIPAKIYEYISAQRPMLLVGGEGATRALVERHGLGLACENETTALKTLLLDLVSSRRAPPSPSAEILARFDYEVLTRELATVLNGAIAKHRSQNST